jgi:hypothetical protein
LTPPKTAEKLATEHGVSPRTVKRAGQYAVRWPCGFCDLQSGVVGEGRFVQLDKPFFVAQVARWLTHQNKHSLSGSVFAYGREQANEALRPVSRQVSGHFDLAIAVPAKRY